jgi:hypothetical protein
VVALIEGKAWATAALGRRLTKKELKEFAEELSSTRGCSGKMANFGTSL